MTNPMTAQQAFDAIKAGDDALRDNLNIKAAELEGWKFHDGVRKLVTSLALSLIPPDYSRDLNAVARLDLPKNMRREAGYRQELGNIQAVRFENILVFPMNFVANVEYENQTDEALARLCCIAAAWGWV
jgi:hypothetical protein